MNFPISTAIIWPCKVRGALQVGCQWRQLQPNRAAEIHSISEKLMGVYLISNSIYSALRSIRLYYHPIRWQHLDYVVNTCLSKTREAHACFCKSKNEQTWASFFHTRWGNCGEERSQHTGAALHFATTTDMQSSHMAEPYISLMSINVIPSRLQRA